MDGFTDFLPQVPLDTILVALLGHLDGQLLEVVDDVLERVDAVLRLARHDHDPVRGVRAHLLEHLETGGS